MHKKNIEQVARGKIFCKGFLCGSQDRKIRCNDCGVYVCSICSVGKRCINCYVKTFNPDWQKVNKDLDNMLVKHGLLNDPQQVKKEILVIK